MATRKRGLNYKAFAGEIVPDWGQSQEEAYVDSIMQDAFVGAPASSRPDDLSLMAPQQIEHRKGIKQQMMGAGADLVKGMLTGNILGSLGSVGEAVQQVQDVKTNARGAVNQRIADTVQPPPQQDESLEEPSKFTKGLRDVGLTLISGKMPLASRIWENAVLHDPTSPQYQEYRANLERTKIGNELGREQIRDTRSMISQREQMQQAAWALDRSMPPEERANILMQLAAQHGQISEASRQSAALSSPERFETSQNAQADVYTRDNSESYRRNVELAENQFQWQAFVEAPEKMRQFNIASAQQAEQLRQGWAGIDVNRDQLAQQRRQHVDEMAGSFVQLGIDPFTARAMAGMWDRGGEGTPHAGALYDTFRNQMTQLAQYGAMKHSGQGGAGLDTEGQKLVTSILANLDKMQEYDSEFAATGVAFVNMYLMGVMKGGQAPGTAPGMVEPPPQAGGWGGEQSTLFGQAAAPVIKPIGAAAGAFAGSIPSSRDMFGVAPDTAAGYLDSLKLNISPEQRELIMNDPSFQPFLQQLWEEERRKRVAPVFEGLPGSRFYRR